MKNAEILVKTLTSKDEKAALEAAGMLVKMQDVEAFKCLVEKSDYLFDFVKNNVARRLKNSINSSNYKNVMSFLKIYSTDFDDILVEKLSQFADEELSDEMYTLLENGSVDEKAYAAKYFSYIPDTIAQDLLEKYAFDENEFLACNSAMALSAMSDEKVYYNAIEKLSSSDEFEQYKAVKFLVAFNNKEAVDKIYQAMMQSAFAENIAAEILYLTSFEELCKNGNDEMAANIALELLHGIPEIIPLSTLVGLQLYEYMQNLINSKLTPLNAQVLLKAYKTFEMLEDADEYLFDESKDTKEEIKLICSLLKSQSNDFWNGVKALMGDGLKLPAQINIVTSLSLIQEYNLVNFAQNVAEIFKNSDDIVKAEAIGTLKELGKLELVNKESVLNSIQNENLKVIVAEYFV